LKTCRNTAPALDPPFVLKLSAQVLHLLLFSRNAIIPKRRNRQLPAEVKGDEMEANFKNGVLDIRLPKSEKTQSKKIKIGIRPPLSDEPNASVPVIPNIGSRRCLVASHLHIAFQKITCPHDSTGIYCKLFVEDASSQNGNS
jgi:hypothetical protein